MKFREIKEGNFDNLDTKANQLLSQEGNQRGEVVKGNDKAEQKVELIADASIADSAKAFSASATNFRDTLNAQQETMESKQAVMNDVQANMMTEEDVAYLEKLYGRALPSLRVMSTFSNVSENPIKAMSELNRMIMDAQR